MYTIRQAAARSGVSIPLLRAWERRYHIVAPARTAAGYRLYDDVAIERLRSMRRLVSAGWSPSTAAAAILSGDPVALDAARAETDAGVATVAPTSLGASGGTGGTGGDDLVETFVSAAAALDAAGLEAVLERMFATGTFEAVADTLLLPALIAVGDAWASGRLGVAGEHAASHAVLRRLAAAYQAAGREPAGHGAILVGMPPGVRHELGALAFSTAARRAGLPVLYLGPDLPVNEWVTAAGRTAARAAVIGVLTADDVGPAVDVATALQAGDPNLLIAFGGRGADRSAAAVASSQPAAGPRSRSPLVLPDPVSAAVRALEAAIAAG
jgi:MerR family transcriptional regulator, light-induced transcriptional regulator